MAGILDKIKNGVTNLVNKVKEKVKAFLEGRAEAKEAKKEERSSPAPSAPAPSQPAPARAPAQEQAPPASPQPRVAGYYSPAPPELNHPVLERRVGETSKGTPINASPNFAGSVKTENKEVSITLPMRNGSSLTVRVPESVIDNGGRVSVEPNGRVNVYKDAKDLAEGRAQSMDMSPAMHQKGGMVRMDDKGQLQSAVKPQANGKTAAALRTLNGQSTTPVNQRQTAPSQGQGQSAPKPDATPPSPAQPAARSTAPAR